MSDQTTPNGAQTDFSKRMSYGDYLHLEPILSAQAPLSAAHDEMLFIVQHQTSELWMKLMLHELAHTRMHLAKGDAAEALKLLARISRIMEQLNSAWDVLRTMTPTDYTTFRDALGQSSGFQSCQYRLIEFALGNRNRAMMKPHAHVPDLIEALEEELAQPSLYQAVLGFARAQGHEVPDNALIPRDTPHQADTDIAALWAKVYRDPQAHWTVYDLAEKLVDLEDYFRRWRFNHVTTVERVIGIKRGTGGTQGVSYLRAMLDVVLFPDLWAIRTEL